MKGVCGRKVQRIQSREEEGAWLPGARFELDKTEIGLVKE